MEYINTFLNLSAFTEAKPNLPKPSLSLIENTNQVYYIKKPSIKAILNVPSNFNNKELPLGGFEYNDPREISAMSERSTAFVNTVDDTSSTEAERQLVKIDEAVEYTPPIVPGYPIMSM